MNMETRQDLYEVSLKGLTLDPISNMPIVILRVLEEARAIPIWIGIFEANAIALELEKVQPPRPMTHDLMAGLLRALGAVVSRIVVFDLQENTFFASIVLQGPDGALTVDSRPSDAIALALRFQAPMFVTRQVLDKSQTLDVDEELYDRDQLKSWLENLKPGDFGVNPS
jgi:bifunctional DNase/RNase